MTLGKAYEAGTHEVRVRRSFARSAGFLLLAWLLALATVPAPASAVTVSALSQPSNTAVNGTASYVINCATTNKAENTIDVTVDFPVNTDLTNVTIASITAVDNTNGTPTTISNFAKVGERLTFRITMAADKQTENMSVTIADVGNASQPGSLGGYTVTMVGKTTSSLTGTINLTANATAVGVGTVSVSTTLTATPATYTVPVTLGALGRLAGTTAAGPNQIVVTFPNASMLTSSTPATSSVTINGVSPASIQIGGAVATLTLPPGQTLAGGSTFDIVFGQGFGIVNPAAGTYTIGVSTTAETGTGTSMFDIVYIQYLTLTISPTSIGFGSLSPGTPSASQTIDVVVSSSDPFTISRAISGDETSMGLTYGGAAVGAKPSGTATYTDTFKADVPWTTEGGSTLTVSVQYTVVF
ncbi:MAG TPA: hypothetical protein VF902_02345 [Coriobacteriia bacterium]